MASASGALSLPSAQRSHLLRNDRNEDGRSSVSIVTTCLSEGEGVDLAFEGCACASLVAFIHPSAWNSNSRKFGCRIVHTAGPIRPGLPPSGVWLRAGPNTL